MTDGRTTGVRSYQRIFSPERRIHQVEGRPLPVPGGVPLRWLGWMLGTLVAVLAVGSGSLFVPAAAAVAAGAGGLTIGDRTAGLLAATAAAAGTLALGIFLGVLDWPFRLVVVPMAILFGAIAAAGGVVQRRMGMPDATVLVLQGILFVVLLVSETFYGRFKVFQPRSTGDRV